MTNIFTKHPKNNDLTYIKHAGRALLYSGLFIFLSIVCIIHAIFPFWCTRFVSGMVQKLHYAMNDEV